VACRYQVSVTAGTVLHNTKQPLTTWFWAAYLVTTDKRGLSALLLQRQLGLGRYETAWMMLHKLRRAMVNPARELLHGEIEIDEAWIGGPQPGLRGSRQLKGRRAALAVVAVERRGKASGRLRMEVIPDFSGPTMVAFARRHIAAGATIYTDQMDRVQWFEQGRVPPRGPQAAASPRAGPRPALGRPPGRSCHRQPPAVADRHASRRQPRAAPGVPR